MGGNCSKVEAGSVRQADRRKSKGQSFVAEVIQEVDRREQRRSKSAMTTNELTTAAGTTEANGTEPTTTGTTVKTKKSVVTKRNTSGVSADSETTKKKQHSEESQVEDSNANKRKGIQKSQTESKFSRKSKTNGGADDQPILVRIEQQRTKCELQVKESIVDLNLEKHQISSIFQLLRDYLSHIKDTKKYWVSMKLLGHSKVEVSSSVVGGSISIVVEYNTGEMTKLRIVHSKEMEKANFDLDTFVFYSKLEQKSLIKISDFNLRVSSKFLRYYIFSESVYYECSLSNMINVQAKSEKPQMSQFSFASMFSDLLDVLKYFSAVKFTHGGIRPSNIYVNKQLQADGRFTQKAHLDLSLAHNTYNRRNTKFRDFAFRQSNDLQMFAITMLSFISSMDIHSIQEPHRKSIILAKLSAPSILQVGNDVRYALSCILKGSDMILEYGASEMAGAMSEHHDFMNKLGLIRPAQMKNSFSYCCNLSANLSDLTVYSFSTKWAFGFSLFENVELDHRVKIRMYYCSGDSVYVIFEGEDSSDLYLTSLNLKKKCLDARVMTLIKQLASAVCKFQDVSTEEEIDMVRAFENFDTSNSGFVDCDSIMQFAMDNKVKDIANSATSTQDINTIIASFDEQNTGRLSFFEFKNMLAFIMNTRPFMVIQVKGHVELPRHYSPAAVYKKQNYLYLVGGFYQSLPTNKCFRFYLKNLHETQEIAVLDSNSTTNGFLIEADQPNKLIFWSWKSTFELEKCSDDYGQHTESQQQSQVVSINMHDVLKNENAADAHLKKKNNILKFQNSTEMHNAMLSQKTFAANGFTASNNNFGTLNRSFTSQIRLEQAMSFPVLLDFDEINENASGTSNQSGFTMNVYNIDKNRWSKCYLESNSILNADNFLLPLHSSGQVLIFEKHNIQKAWLMRVSLSEVYFHETPLFFEDKSAVEQLIRGCMNHSVNVAFYENSLLILDRSNQVDQFFYGVFMINEVSGRVSYSKYELISYLSKYERVSKAATATSRYECQKKSLGGGSLQHNGNVRSGLKMKIGRYTADKLLAGFGETMIFSAYRATMPGVEIRILSRVINNVTEKIDDIYETVKFLTENRLSGRMAPLKDFFFTFDPTASHIKVNLLYTSDDVDHSMAMVIAGLINDRDEARRERIQSRSSHTRKVHIGSNSITFEHPAAANKRMQQQQSQFLSAEKKHLKRKQRMQKMQLVEYPARLHELIRSLRNVLICVHYMQQQRFYLKEVSPHTLVRLAEGKYFSPINFYHETTFTTINSDAQEPVLSKESAAFEDYLPPQLKKAHDDGLCLNEVSYNLHKANIFSLGLVFLHYAGISRRPYQLSSVDNTAQLRLQKAIHSLPFPKYFQSILAQMLKFNEDERSNAAVLLDQLSSIVENHKIDIYFPQLSSFSAFNNESGLVTAASSQKSVSLTSSQSNMANHTAEHDFFYTLDNINKVLFVGGKQALVEFRKTFKVSDFGMTMNMTQIVGITKFSHGFYAIVKYKQEPREEIDMPSCVLKYILVRLVGLPNNPKQLQGTSLGMLSQFSGRDIISLNLFAVDDKRVLIVAGQENTSIGVMAIREVYSCHIGEGNEDGDDEYEDKEFHHLDPNECKTNRLDDLKASVNRGIVIKYDPAAFDHRWFDPDSALDGDEPSIFERSEEEENDESTMYDHNLLDEIASYDGSDEEEEEKKDNEGSGDANRAHSQEKHKKAKKWEYYVLDTTTQLSNRERKRYVVLQTISLDGSVELRNIGIQVDRCSCGNRFKNSQESQQQVLSFVPLTDSLVVAFDLTGCLVCKEKPGHAYLISLVTFKSILLPIVSESLIAKDSETKGLQMDEQVRSLVVGEARSLDGKPYQILSEKSFSVVYEMNGQLVASMYELDTQMLELHYVQRTLVASVFDESRLSDSKKQISESKKRIILPKLTMEVDSIVPAKEIAPLKAYSPQNGQKLQMNSLFGQINEMPDDEGCDNTPYTGKAVKKQAKLSKRPDEGLFDLKKPSSQSSKKSTLGKIEQIDKWVEYEGFQQKMQQQQEQQEQARGIQLRTGNSTDDVLSMIRNKIENNKEQLDEVSLEPSQNNSAIRATPIPPFKPTQQQIDFYSGRLNREDEDEADEKEVIILEESKQMKQLSSEGSTQQSSSKTRVKSLKQMFSVQNQSSQKIVAFKQQSNMNQGAQFSNDDGGGYDDEDEDEDSGQNDDFNLINFNTSFEQRALQHDQSQEDMLIVLEEDD